MSSDESSRAPIDSSSLALIVCDMQNDFIHDKGAFAIHSGKTQPGKSIVPVIKKILDAARAAKLPIFYTKVVNRKDGIGQSSRTSRRIGALMEGSWGIEIVDELAPTTNDFVIVKWRFSAFYSTALEVMLRGLNIKTIALCGVSTSGGVDSNARDAEYRDYNVVVLGDACADKNQKLHEADLERLGSTFGRVMNSSDFIAQIEKR